MPKKPQKTPLFDELREQGAYNYEIGSFTLKDFTDLIANLRKSSQKDPLYTMPADDYSMLSDDDFRDLCKSKYIKFVGGMEGCHRMRERCKKLKII